MSKEPDLDGEEQVCSFAATYVKAAEAIDMWKHINAWKFSEGIPNKQGNPSHVLYRIDIYFIQQRLFRNARNIPA